MSEKDVHILVVENEEAHAELIRRAFELRGGDVRLTLACNLGEARRYLAEFVPDLVIADLLLPDGKGTELLPGEKEKSSYPVVVMTGYGDEQVAVEAMKAGALDYVVKSEAMLADMPHLTERTLREWHHITECKQAEEDIRKAKESYDRITDNADEAIFRVEAEGGHVIYVNPAAERIFGYSRAEWLADPALGFKIIHPDFKEKQKQIIKEVNTTKKTIKSAVLGWIAKDGREVIVEYTIMPIVDKNGKVVCFESIGRDITDRKRAEEMLRESEEQYRAVFEQAVDSIVLIEAATGQLVRFNDRAHESLGYTRDEFRKLKIPDLEVIESAEEVAGHIKEIIKKGTDTFETRHRTKSGEIRNIRVDTRAISIGGKDFIQAMWRDITEHKRAEEKLLDYQAQLKSLASELQLTEERERRRLAIGLHDKIGQNLALTKLAVQSLMVSVSNSGVLASLDKVCASIDKTIQDTHSLIFELSNPVLYELGFKVAVEQWLGEQIQEKCGIKYKFNVVGEDFQLDNEISIVLFAAVRELLVNIVKHAKAETVEVGIRKSGDKVKVTVADDGIGFVRSELSSYSPKNRTGGFGLFSIRERLEYLGGDIAIKSLPGEGTCVILTTPLKR